MTFPSIALSHSDFVDASLGKSIKLSDYRISLSGFYNLTYGEEIHLASVKSVIGDIVTFDVLSTAEQAGWAKAQLDSYASLLLAPGPLPSASWYDIVVLTAADEAQAHTFEILLSDLQQQGRIPRARYLVTADPSPPPGAKAAFVGCGGATIHVLRTLRDLNISLTTSAVLVVHAGGQSKRTPHCSAVGKIFATVPIAIGATAPVTTLEMVLANTFPLRPAAGVVVCCSDVVLVYDPVAAAGAFRDAITSGSGGSRGGDEHDEGVVVALATPSSLRIAAGHGVFVPMAVGFGVACGPTESDISGAVSGTGAVGGTGAPSLSPGVCATTPPFVCGVAAFLHKHSESDLAATLGVPCPHSAPSGGATTTTTTTSTAATTSTNILIANGIIDPTTPSLTDSIIYFNAAVATRLLALFDVAPTAILSYETDIYGDLLRPLGPKAFHYFDRWMNRQHPMQVVFHAALCGDGRGAEERVRATVRDPTGSAAALVAAAANAVQNESMEDTSATATATTTTAGAATASSTNHLPLTSAVQFRAVVLPRSLFLHTGTLEEVVAHFGGRGGGGGGVSSAVAILPPTPPRPPSPSEDPHAACLGPGEIPFGSIFPIVGRCEARGGGNNSHTATSSCVMSVVDGAWRTDTLGEWATQGHTHDAHNSSDGPHVVTVGLGTYIDACNIGRGVRIGRGCVLSGVVIPPGEVVPDAIMLHTLPLRVDRWEEGGYGEGCSDVQMSDAGHGAPPPMPPPGAVDATTSAPPPQQVRYVTVWVGVHDDIKRVWGARIYRHAATAADATTAALVDARRWGASAEAAAAAAAVCDDDGTTTSAHPSPRLHALSDLVVTRDLPSLMAMRVRHTAQCIWYGGLRRCVRAARRRGMKSGVEGAAWADRSRRVGCTLRDVRCVARLAARGGDGEGGDSGGHVGVGVGLGLYSGGPGSNPPRTIPANPTTAIVDAAVAVAQEALDELLRFTADRWGPSETPGTDGGPPALGDGDRDDLTPPCAMPATPLTAVDEDAGDDDEYDGPTAAMHRPLRVVMAATLGVRRRAGGEGALAAHDGASARIVSLMSVLADLIDGDN